MRTNVTEVGVEKILAPAIDRAEPISQLPDRAGAIESLLWCRLQHAQRRLTSVQALLDCRDITGINTAWGYMAGMLDPAPHSDALQIPGLRAGQTLFPPGTILSRAPSLRNLHVPKALVAVSGSIQRTEIRILSRKG